MVGNLIKLSGAVLFPWVLFTVYLNQTRWPTPQFTTATDYTAGAVAIAFGLIAIATLKLARTTKAIAMVAYIPVAWLALLIYGVGYVCSKFGSCL
jgi:hypothetical protein